MPSDLDVVVVGGGPVGLFLGCRLAQHGVRFVVLEKRAGERGGSRAIGVHAPSLERLEALGVAEPLCREGVRVERGLVYSSRRLLGQVDLTRAPGRFPFVLSVPQARTEALLAERLESLRPGAIVRGARVTHAHAGSEDARVHVRAPDGQSAWLSAHVVVGCDGKESVVRRGAGIALRGGARPEGFVMADFDDSTNYGADAAIILADSGLVESFPLPRGRRRWVAQADGPTREPSADELAQYVTARTGYHLDPATAEKATTFVVEQRRAPALVSGRLAVAGDAAHLVSPFGGQGMNLGFLDAWDLAETLSSALAEERLDAALRGYERRRTRAARRAIRRGAFNGMLGRRRRHPRPRNAVVAGFLAAAPERLLCELFTMRGLA